MAFGSRKDYLGSHATRIPDRALLKLGSQSTIIKHAREQAEYIWSDYSEMLDFIFPETGKNMRTMLNDLSDIDLKIISSQTRGTNK